MKIYHYLLGLALAVGPAPTQGIRTRQSQQICSISLENKVISHNTSVLPPTFDATVSVAPYGTILPEAIGTPSRGRLSNGRKLESEYTFERSKNRYGTAELVETIGQAARAMYQKTQAELVVNDLSRAQGGKFRPHKSHQNGLDADVGHYFIDGSGKYYSANLKINAANKKDLDVNWQLVVRLQQGIYEVDELYWSPRYIRAMKEHVLEGYGSEAWERYGTKLKGWKGHTTHLHVRMKEVNRKEAEMVTDNGGFDFRTF